MSRNRAKDYAIHNPGNEPVSIADYRKVPWQQSYYGNVYDFRRWLYVGKPCIDELEHRLPDELGGSKNLIHAGRDEMVEAIRNAVWLMPSRRETTKNAYCKCGLTNWFEFLDFRSAAGYPVYELTDINQEVIWGYIRWLRDSRASNTDTGRLSYAAAQTKYSQTKAVLNYLTHQRALPEGLFPRNPFPNCFRAIVGHKPYSKRVMSALMSALYKDIQGLRNGTLKISDTQVLTVYLIVIAARTGRNPTPLVELTRDAVKAHPIKPDKLGLLVTYKRRSNKTSIQAFETPNQIENMVSIPIDAISLYNEAVALTKPLVTEVPPEVKNRLWLFRHNGSGRGTKNKIYALTVHKAFMAAQNIIKRHALRDDDGKPFQLNISRLRKTFAQRMWQLCLGR